MTAQTDVVVVGGGVAGLVCARDLARAGLGVVLLEATGRLGGCVGSHALAGLRLDSGAESFATRTTAVVDLLGELGLADDVVPPARQGAWLQLARKAVPLPPAGVLGIPGRVWAPEVVRVIGVPGALRATLDGVLPASVGGPAGSLGALVRRRMGRRVLERLVAPVVRGVHSAHPDDVDVEAVLPGAGDLIQQHGSLAAAAAAVRAGTSVAGSAVAGLRGGMHRLVPALTDDLVGLGVTVRTETPVDRLDRDDQGWQVRTRRGVHRARAVVVAVPGAAAVTLLDAHAPGVRAVVPPSDTWLVLATLVVDGALGTPRGTGVLVAAGAGVRAKALTHATAKWAWLAEAAGPDRHVLRLSYGLAGPPEDAPGGAELRAMAVADAGRLLGVPLADSAVIAFARTTWAHGPGPARPGQRIRAAGLRAALAADGLHPAGAWVAGTGLAAVVADARRTARDVLAGFPGTGGRAPSADNSS